MLETEDVDRQMPSVDRDPPLGCLPLNDASESRGRPERFEWLVLQDTLSKAVPLLNDNRILF